jgi:cobalt-zinc-cadmium efflux system membrane fusion protein
MKKIQFLPALATWLAALMLATAGCSSNEGAGATATEKGEAHAGEGDEHGDEHAEEGASEAIKLTSEELEAAGIKLARVEANVLQAQVRAPGEVIDDAYGTTLITPRVEGLVVKRHARLGDEVEAGAALVTLTSVAISEAQGELTIAAHEWQRLQELGPEAVSGRRYTEARVAYEQAQARARAYGAPGSGKGGRSGEFTLTAPHAGRITEDAFVVGERIEPGRPLFRLVDERVVWIDARLPAPVAQRVPAGSPATVVVAGTRLSGKVLRQGHRTSEATRTASVRIEVDNRDDWLHAGDYVDVYLDNKGDDRPQLAVPNGALVQFEGRPSVFRQGSDGSIVPVEVRTGPVVGDETLIEEGLAAGDTVVVGGAFEVKSRLLKSQLGEGHAH